jgi:hypothetical protein
VSAIPAHDALGILRPEGKLADRAAEEVGAAEIEFDGFDLVFHFPPPERIYALER